VIVRPDLVPGYDIVERLGVGGVSGVFRALRDDDGLEVALKITSLAELDPEFRPQERFEREAELLARLSHPALPRFHDWGVTLEGFGWIALELVKGVPLSHFALRPAWELIPILIPVAEALAAVARAGIVHRDVAPDNVLVVNDGGRFAPKLIDFGVAKDLFAADAAGLTQHGAFLGKLLYAPPEQLLGLPKGQTLDFRADIYSFGLMTWELFAGRPPSPPSSSRTSERPPRARLPRLSIPDARGPAPRLVDLVERMTARRREDRPSSWEEIVAGLWQALDEVRPVAREIAERRAELSPFGEERPLAHGADADSVEAGENDRNPFPEASAPLYEEAPSLEPAARLLTRELFFGRVVLFLGAAAFVGSLAFALHVVVSAPEAPATVGAAAPGATGSPPPAPPAIPSPGRLSSLSFRRVPRGGHEPLRAPRLRPRASPRRPHAPARVVPRHPHPRRGRLRDDALVRDPVGEDDARPGELPRPGVRRAT
jgi:serine/threonine protein kinase